MTLLAWFTLQSRAPGAMLGDAGAGVSDLAKVSVHVEADGTSPTTIPDL